MARNATRWNLPGIVAGTPNETGCSVKNVARGADDVYSRSLNSRPARSSSPTAADSDDDKQAKINVRADELDVNNDFAFVQLSITVATAASAIAAILYGFEARYQPGTDSGDELASVDETVK